MSPTVVTSVYMDLYFEKIDSLPRIITTVVSNISLSKVHEIFLSYKLRVRFTQVCVHV